MYGRINIELDSD